MCCGTCEGFLEKRWIPPKPLLGGSNSVQFYDQRVPRVTSAKGSKGGYPDLCHWSDVFSAQKKRLHVSSVIFFVNENLVGRNDSSNPQHWSSRAISGTEFTGHTWLICHVSYQVFMANLFGQVNKIFRGAMAWWDECLTPDRSTFYIYNPHFQISLEVLRTSSLCCVKKARLICAKA